MNPIDWLYTREPGFAELLDEDHQAIFHFTLLWSLFENRALGTQGSSKKIHALVQELESQGRLDVVPFRDSLEYFCDRYFFDGVFTNDFDGLQLRPTTDKPELVQAVLKRENTNPADVIAAILIVVYRLRNNLFHGVKWAYDIHGQLSNFTHANTVLMKLMEIKEKSQMVPNPAIELTSCDSLQESALFKR